MVKQYANTAVALLASLASLVPQSQAAAADNSTGVITSDSYFYGQSPPVYPAPRAKGTGDWSHANAQATAFVKAMTLDEKVNFTSGTTSDTSCVGNVGAIERLGFPGMCLQDAENGVRGEELVSAWPAGIHVAASWNKDLANLRGKGMGGEFVAKGINTILGPVVGPMGRTVVSGRIWEGFGPDPYLSGAIAADTISGLQSRGVGACTKHFIGNEQETMREPVGNISSVSANIDDRTMHELYLWPFQDAVLAGASSVMCAYSRVNNSYSCQNSKTINGLLKTELGFEGFVVTDWGGLHGGAAAVLAGVDLAMPNSGGLWGDYLQQAVQNGTVPESRLDDMVTRVMTMWYMHNQNKLVKEPGFGMPADLTVPHKTVDARDPAYKSVLYQGAVEGHVLLKNTGNALPLKKPKILSVFGFSARSTDRHSLSSDWNLNYAPYNMTGIPVPVTGPLPLDAFGPIAINGTLYSGGGSGASSQTLVSSPMDAINQQAWEDDTNIFWDFSTDAPTVNAESDACIVVTNLYASEGEDRPALESNYTSSLISNVANTCNNTIVIIHNAGPAVVDASWYDLPNVKAVIFAHLPGQYSGKALVDLLYGRENFSGKLPFTIAKTQADYGDLLFPEFPSGKYALFPQADFTEGVYIDYRRFDVENITPQFEFGYGMSYTSFDYSSIRIRKQTDNHWNLYPTGKIAVGGQQDLWDQLVSVTVSVRNSGSVGGAEVAQLYVKMPGAGKNGNAVKQLRGFDKKTIKSGASTTYTFQLTRRDLSVWDTTAQKWQLQPGSYTVMVGSSSRNLPLQASFTI